MLREVEQTHLPMVISQPVCDQSEDRWLEFLLYISQKNLAARRAVPKPSELEIYDMKHKLTHTALSVRKRNIERIIFGYNTHLCLTGPLAGALCIPLSADQEMLEDWNIRPKSCAADVVALRMIRRDWSIRAKQKERLKKYYQFEVDDSSNGWFLEILLHLLNELGWEHDSEQIEVNAVDNLNKYTYSADY